MIFESVRFALLCPNRDIFKDHGYKKLHYTLSIVGFAAVISSGIYYKKNTFAATSYFEPAEACVIQSDASLTPLMRAHYAQCLGWRANDSSFLCGGYYQPFEISPLPEGEVQIQADEASLYVNGRSRLTGRVEVQENLRVVNAETAYIYRDPKTNQVTRIELLDNVQYREPERLMIARKAVINPQDQSGRIEDVLYRFHTERARALLPAWGRASFIERFANKDYLLNKATYSTCAPQDRAWEIEAQEITLDYSESKGVARNAVLKVHDWPVLYAPYFSFPTSRERKSGFLLPVYGYTNIGGFDLGLPYYWNMAPNYDATIVPHIYSRRGLMVGGNFRYLTPYSTGIFSGNILPDDRAFSQFITQNQEQYPSLQGLSNNRWAVSLLNRSQLNPNLRLGLNYQEVSDDYYFQDFSTDLAVATQNQLLRQGDASFTTEHWLFRGMVQSYQTLHPVNQSVVSDIYQRLPQLVANGVYNDLPGNTNFLVLGQFDNYRWTNNQRLKPQGPRFHLNPVLSMEKVKPWGYLTPAVQVVENKYTVKFNGTQMSRSFNRLIPRYSMDSGLFFERLTTWMGRGFTQTLEPRLFYLYVPYHDQTPIPVYDSAYMIFNTNQLFRFNRFSGFDRIGDTNQLSYAATTRWLSDATGKEQANFTIGQIRYFSNRRVQLCYNSNRPCVDRSVALGYLSPDSEFSPIATRAQYHLSPDWDVTGDYVWDVYTKSTNNGHLNLHYQPEVNRVMSFGYTYLVNGDRTRVRGSNNIKNNALHQATFAYAWPFSDHWSSLGVYSYNVSKQYGMMSFLGVQYDDCCWAVRLMGGRTFKSISPTTLAPQYNNNIFLQVLLKGLGSAANSDPSSIITSYLPGYADIFK